MAEAIEVAPGVRVPGAAITVKAARASGPGGQNVNKVSSRIELFVEVARIEGLDEEARGRLARLAGRRISSEGLLRVTSQDERDQRRNLESAREKARALVAAALAAPRRRRRSVPSASDRERRLHAKRRDALLKASRKPPAPETD